jgi:hypothetical protein
MQMVVYAFIVGYGDLSVIDISKHEDAIFRLIFIVLMRILDYNG